MSTFIRKHAAYLEEKVATFRELRTDYVRDAAKSKDQFAAMTNAELANSVKVLEQQMQQLLDTEVSSEVWSDK
jgi:hypothetical protein